MQDPETYTEWQEIAVAAAAWLLIDDARIYGLITGGPEVNRERCVEIIDRAEQDYGITVSLQERHEAAARILWEVARDAG